jgi:hypothetical protein
MMNMAEMGRFGDNNIAHVQTGEMVVPKSVLDNNPSLKVGIQRAIATEGNDPRRYTVGDPRNSINPMTGQPEFFDFKKLLPILGAVLLPGIGSGIAGALGLTGTAGKVVGSALTGALASGLTGGSPIQGALTGGLGGALFPSSGNLFASTGDATKTDVLKKAITDPSANVKPVPMLAELAYNIGLPKDSTVGKLLSTQLGSGIASGLLASLLASGDEDEEMVIDARKFGTGKDYASTPLIDYGKEGSVLQPFRANTGGSIFPRRDGGIMPSEGSGQVDDVPAMLTAGEFVLTKDAVKGLGGGDQNTGIQRAYNMMDSLERMA